MPNLAQVQLQQPATVEEVDDEIIIVSGCALGLVGAGQPPHVLQVGEGTEVDKLGIIIDDYLVAVNGRSTRGMMTKDEVVRHLRGATQLEFERSGGGPAEVAPEPEATPETSKAVAAAPWADLGGKKPAAADDTDDDDDEVEVVDTKASKRTAPLLAPRRTRLRGAVDASDRRRRDDDEPPRKRPAVVLVPRKNLFRHGCRASRREDDEEENEEDGIASSRRRALSPESIDESPDCDDAPGREPRASADERKEPTRHRKSVGDRSKGSAARRPGALETAPVGGAQHVPGAGAAVPHPGAAAWDAAAMGYHAFYGHHPYGHAPGLLPPVAPPPGGHPNPWEAWWLRSTEQWYAAQAHAAGAVPAAPAAAAGQGSTHGRQHRGPPLVERNESGGFALVAERIPPRLQNFDVLNDYFSTFGPVMALQINNKRHECIVSYSSIEHAEAAILQPVSLDPSIGLRPWRSRGSAQPPQASEPTPSAPVCAAPVTAPAACGVQAPPLEAERPSGPSAGNLQLESGLALEKKRQRTEVAGRRKALLQGLTDQMKVVMAKISDPKTPEKNREQLQVLLTSIRDKITALTPSRDEVAKHPRLTPPSRIAKEPDVAPPSIEALPASVIETPGKAANALAAEDSATVAEGPLLGGDDRDVRKVQVRCSGDSRV
mmetsp:Transcript_34921/g.96436  ORF Transcript_34921/g.96436 Transcript_34921/m.96436 type:complete len:660 (-) Transcript_34921:120-2099(-)